MLVFSYLKKTTTFENNHYQSKTHPLEMLHLHTNATLSTFMDDIMTIPSINYQFCYFHLLCIIILSNISYTNAQLYFLHMH